MTPTPNKSDGDILFATDLFKFVGNDNTGSVSNSTTETQIAEVIIAADDLNSLGVYQFFGYYQSQFTNRTGTFKMYVGTSSSFGSNSLVSTVTVGSSSGSGDISRDAVAMCYVDTSSTFTGQVYVQITAQMSSADTNTRGETRELIVFGV